MPFSDYDADMRSQSTFADAKLALKDAKNKNYFRAKLVTNCQTEFQLSTKNVSFFFSLFLPVVVCGRFRFTLLFHTYFAFHRRVCTANWSKKRPA